MFRFYRAQPTIHARWHRVDRDDPKRTLRVLDAPVSGAGREAQLIVHILGG